MSETDPARPGAEELTAADLALLGAEPLRPSDPQAILADPSLIVADLGWQPALGLDVFLEDMLAAAPTPIQP